MKLLRCGVSAMLLVACGETTSLSVDAGADTADATRDVAADTAADKPVDSGPTCTTAQWNPRVAAFDQWPDTRIVTADASTATGVRLHVDPVRFAATIRATGGFASLLTDLDTLDGFGVNAQAFFRYNRAFDVTRLPSAEATLTASGGVGFVVLSPGAPRLEGALVTTTDDDATLLLAPLHPLPPNARVAAYVTRALTAAAGGCLEPSPALAAELASPGDDTTRAVAALTALGVVREARELVSLTVFPTQTVTEESVAVARDIAGRSFSVSARRPCTDDPMGRFRACELEFVAGDYLDAQHHLTREARPQSTYTLKATVWLPRTGSAPYRTLVYGHGLGGGRAQGQRLAEFAAPQGIATIAIDAAVHGEHPLNPMPGAATLVTVLNFFTLNPGASMAFDARALRDHFRQSTWDKLQLVRLLQAGVDVDGDGSTDLDATRLGYLGVSLGGIMGAEPLSLTDAFGAAVLVVPGGRVSAIISDSSTFAPIILAFRPPGTTRGDVVRAFPLLQTLLDRGDAASYGAHVLQDRLTPGGSRVAPSVLLGVVLDDDTVPNVSNYTLARAMGVSIVPPLLRAAPGLVTTRATPLSGNAAMGRATAGLLQFDVVLNNGMPTRATHSNVGASAVGAEAWLHFLSTHWSRGLAEIDDPYRAVGLMHGAMP